MLINLLLLLLGIALLSAGGEVLIRGAVGAARRLGVSPLLTGLVIVGFGTSTPELVVSLDAVLRGAPELALANVIGSNIGNLLLILAVCALIAPLAVDPKALYRDASCVVAATVLFIVLAALGPLGPLSGLVLLLGLTAYLVVAWRGERVHPSAASEVYVAEEAQIERTPHSVPALILAIVSGLVLLIVGSRVLLGAAIDLATDLGVSQVLIGVTMVAIGTSLPELSVTIIAALRRQADVAVGNLLGSNLFNLLGIVGLSAMVGSLPVDGRLMLFDQWVMLATAVLVGVFLYSDRTLSRFEGGVLVVCYGLYIAAGIVWFAQ